MRTCRFCAEEIQDAAIVCKHCGRDLIPRQPTAVPETVAADPRPTTKKSAWPVIALVLGLVGLVWIVNRSGAASSPNSPAETKTLAVSVAWSPGALQITNTGSNNVGGTITAYINGSPPFTYKAEAVMPAVGEHVEIPLRLFTMKDGERFNPTTHAVTVAWVGGGGYDYRRFGQ